MDTMMIPETQEEQEIFYFPQAFGPYLRGKMQPQAHWRFQQVDVLQDELCAPQDGTVVLVPVTNERLKQMAC